MKKILPIAFALVAVLFSCKKEKQDEGVFPDSISLSKTELSLEVDESETLTVTFDPAEASDQYVRWFSSNSSVAGVSEGVVYGRAPGVSTITARSGSAEASCEVTVRKKPLSVSITDLTVETDDSDNDKASLSCAISILNADDEFCELNFYLATSANGSVGSPVYTWTTSTFFCSHPGSPYTLSYTAIKLKPYQTYYFAVSVSVDGGTFWSESRREFSILQMNPVDLGIVVGGKKVLWGDRNLFATSITATGSYYPWGGLETTTGKSENYTYTGNPSTLPLSQDIAHVALGGNWRMPTAAEMSALIAKCTPTYAREGCRMTSTNGEYIALPRARCWANGKRGQVDEGLYWTSSIASSSSSSAQALQISWINTQDLEAELSSYPRYHALPIRPVYVE